LTLYDRRAFTPPTDLPVIPLKSSTTAKTRIPAAVESEGGYDLTFDLGSSAFALVDKGKLADRKRHREVRRLHPIGRQDVFGEADRVRRLLTVRHSHGDNAREFRGAVR